MGQSCKAFAPPCGNAGGRALGAAPPTAGLNVNDDRIAGIRGEGAAVPMAAAAARELGGAAAAAPETAGEEYAPLAAAGAGGGG